MKHKQSVFCEHYRAMSDHDTCLVGISYSTFQGMKFDDRPCFSHRGEPMRPGCDKCLLPTEEQLAERDRKMAERIQSTIIARIAITEHIGVPWKRGSKSVNGAIDCPVCKAEKALHYSRAGYNGHIHAACTTENCVKWME